MEIMLPACEGLPGSKSVNCNYTDRDGGNRTATGRRVAKISAADLQLFLRNCNHPTGKRQRTAWQQRPNWLVWEESQEFDQSTVGDFWPNCTWAASLEVRAGPVAASLTPKALVRQALETPTPVPP